MPKSHSYGASYPSGAVIAHTGEVLAGPDEGNDAPRIEDSSRPGGAENATPIDETPASENDADEKSNDADEKSNAKPAKRTNRSQR